MILSFFMQNYHDTTLKIDIPWLLEMNISWSHINILGLNETADIYKYICFQENSDILIEISLNLSCS